jgi:hypothetical protein
MGGYEQAARSHPVGTVGKEFQRHLDKVDSQRHDLR